MKNPLGAFTMAKPNMWKKSYLFNIHSPVHIFI